MIGQARIDDSIFLIVGDLGFSVVEPFVKEFPERYRKQNLKMQNQIRINKKDRLYKRNTTEEVISILYIIQGKGLDEHNKGINYRLLIW